MTEEVTEESAIARRLCNDTRKNSETYLLNLWLYEQCNNKDCVTVRKQMTKIHENIYYQLLYGS